MSTQCSSQAFRVNGDMKTIDELLRAYPQLAFNPSDQESLLLWKDLVKAATPKNQKKDLSYDEAVMNSLLAIEFSRLVNLRNVMLDSMRELGRRCTKVALLKSVSEKTGLRKCYSLGGGKRPDTKRLILIYESEAEVTAKKRKSCERRSYFPRKKNQLSVDLMEECHMHYDHLMHGDSFQNLFDEDHHGIEATTSSSAASSSSSSSDSFYSSGGENNSIDEFISASDDGDDFEVIDVEDFDD